jgi:nicotinamide-nucleotide amidase
MIQMQNADQDPLARGRLLAAELGELLLAQHMTLALAESCTGGLIASLITDIAGSSAYFPGGVVAYAYEAKERLLGVSHETLMAHGAVSYETAQEMAQGAVRTFSTDMGLSVTGIAGPGGATPDKPVGLVHLHLSAAGVQIGEQHLWDSDRIGNKILTAEAALALAIRHLRGAPVEVGSAASLPDFIAAPVRVTVRLLSDGQVMPTGFTWRGRKVPIADVGRTWREASGGSLGVHWLVRSPNGDTYDLRHDLAQETWTLVRAWLRSGREA